jgi:hypothetical protein
MSWFRNNTITITHKFRQSFNLQCMKKYPLEEECRRLSEADHPVAHVMRLNGEHHFILRKEKGSAACIVCKASKLWKETIN